MPESPFRELFDKYLGGQMSAEEIVQLQYYVQDSNNSDILDELLMAAYNKESFSVVDREYDLDNLYKDFLMRKDGIDRLRNLA